MPGSKLYFVRQPSLEETTVSSVLREVAGKTFYSFHAYNAYIEDLPIYCEFTSEDQSSLVSLAYFKQTVSSLTKSISLVECELPLEDIVNSMLGTEISVRLNYNMTESTSDSLTLQLTHEQTITSIN